MAAEWANVSFVISSNTRFGILIALVKGHNTPSRLSHLLGISMSNISRALRELEQRGLTVCLTPGVKRGRIYTSTDLGRNVIRRIKDEMSLALGQDKTTDME